MQDNNETSIREPTVQRAEQDGELARVEHRGSSAWVGSNRGPTEPNSVDFTPSSRPLPTKTETRRMVGSPSTACSGGMSDVRYNYAIPGPRERVRSLRYCQRPSAHRESGFGNDPIPEIALLYFFTSLFRQNQHPRRESSILQHAAKNQRPERG
jgi:hypothetical protein